MTISDDDDLSLPPALAAIAAIGFADEGDDEEDDDYQRIDFELFDEFMDAEDTADWFRSWTGNPDVEGEQFRVFGQDGGGGYAAFWLVREDAALIEQPVVFLGSEGEAGVVACDLAAFLWLVADGSGPYEAVEHPTRRSRPNAEFGAVAEKHAAGARMTARDVIAAARDEFPDFEDEMEQFVR